MSARPHRAAGGPAAAPGAPTTAQAQRRLLGAVAQLRQTPGGIDGLRLAVPSAIALSIEQGVPVLAQVWRALDDLLAAVEADHTKEKHP